MINSPFFISGYWLFFLYSVSLTFHLHFIPEAKHPAPAHSPVFFPNCWLLRVLQKSPLVPVEVPGSAWGQALVCGLRGGAAPTLSWFSRSWEDGAGRVSWRALESYQALRSFAVWREIEFWTWCWAKRRAKAVKRMEVVSTRPAQVCFDIWILWMGDSLWGVGDLVASDTLSVFLALFLIVSDGFWHTWHFS